MLDITRGQKAHNNREKKMYYPDVEEIHFVNFLLFKGVYTQELDFDLTSFVDSLGPCKSIKIL